MKVLDNDSAYFLWGAERPFQIQLLAGLGRLGMDVLAASTTADGKKLVDQFYPKGKDSTEVPEDFQGTILWAAPTELFSNSTLSYDSMKELEGLIEMSTKHKIFAMLPQSSYPETKSLFDGPNRNAIYLPCVVGFGDQNVFEKTLAFAQETGNKTSQIQGEFLSTFDAVALVLSALKAPKLPTLLWVQGSTLEEKSIQDGLQEIEDSGALGSLQYLYKKMTGKTPHFAATQSLLPANVQLANEFFPTVLTPWARFFRDAYRIYKSTPDAGVLLHFRPGKTP